ncbi:MAG: DUF1385 domain-containing protein [Chloroflexi bacterium]|nr:DUF1385 domain-containing protein [Chloroflexota bacterium]
MADRFYYGGQAVIEGVMMRGRKAMVTVVRRPSRELAMAAHPLAAVYTGRMRKTPLVRGIIVLIEAMALGIKALMYSANVSLEEEEQTSGWLVWAMVVLAVGVAVVLFFLAPLFLSKLFGIGSPLLFNLVEGFIRLAIFIAYLKLMSLLPDIRRVFAYHGAEHKVVNAYEDGAPLEVEAARKYNTAHVRCGTSFLFAVMVIAIVVFTLVGLPSLWLMVLSRVVLVPVIAALGYEVIYFGSRHRQNGLLRAMTLPGLWLQSLTTREPDNDQLEVAISALRKVVEIDQQPEEAAQVSS